MGDRLQGDVVHARQPGRSALGQGRQLPAVALGQVAPGRADLFFDEMEVIEQPFARGRDLVARRNRRRQPAAGRDQDALVRGQTRQQLIRHTSGPHAVGGRKAHAVLLHLIGAEQLRPQRRLVVERHPRRYSCPRTRSCQAYPDPAPRPKEL